jgi:hypothetical protein
MGQLLNNGLLPVSAFTGGIIGPICPPNAVNPNDLAKPADSAEGAAARIKADEAAAAARRAAVRYLGTVDCHYWPEAQDALVNALLQDRNECVRTEAAIALGRGCCCTRKTIEALAVVVSGSERFGNPAEKSERVKAAARAALEHCVACRTADHALIGPGPAPVEENGIETPPASPTPRPVPPLESLPGKTALDRTGHPVAGAFVPSPSVPEVAAIESARQTLSANPDSRPPRSLFGLISNAMNRPSAPAREVISQEPPPVAPPQTAVPRNAPPATLGPVSFGQPAPAHQPVPKPVASTSVQVAYTPVPQPAAAPPSLPIRGAAGTAQATPPAQAATRAPYTTTAWYPNPTAARNQEQHMGSHDVRLALLMLDEAYFAEQRVAAAESLATADWTACPLVVPALLKAAREDKAPTVRVACIRCIGRLNANTVPVIRALHEIRKDSDPVVAREAEQILVRFVQNQVTLPPGNAQPYAVR